MINRVPVTMDGGVNLWADSTKIRDDQLVLGKNIIPVAPGQYGTRPAMKWVRDVMWKPSQRHTPIRAAFSPVGPNFALVAWVNGEQKLFAIDETANSSITLGPAPSPIPATLMQWDGDTYAFTGINSGARLAYAAGPGYVLEALDFGSGNADFKPKGAAVIRDRFVYWGFKDGAGGRAVLFADRGFPLRIGDSAVASGRFIPVAAISASGITHCAEINTQGTGSPNQSVVAVWTSDQMWMLLGEPGETGDGLTPEAIIGSLQQNLLPMAAGCVSGATVVQTPYGTIWAGPDDVWFMPFGSLPVRIGTHIRPALLATPPGLRWKWHASYDADTAQYRLAIFGPDTGPTEYNGCDDHWILDLSRGAPDDADKARWYGPQEYQQSVTDAVLNGTFCLLTDLGANGSRLTYGMCVFDETLSAGQVSGISLVTLNAADSVDSCAPYRDQIRHADNAEYFVGDEIVPYDEIPPTAANAMLPYVWRVAEVDGLGPNGGGVTGIGAVGMFNTGNDTVFADGGVTWRVKDDAGVGIPLASFIPRSYYAEANVIRPQILTKEYMGDEMVDSLIDGAELGYWTEKNGRLSYRFLNDAADNTRVIDAPPDQLGISGFFSSGSPNPPLLRASRNWKSRLLPGVGGRRSVSKSFQLYLTQDTVFVVNDTNDKIVISVGGQPAVALSVAHGEYVYADLLAAIAAPIELAYPTRVLWVTTYIGSSSLEGISFEDDIFETYRIYFQKVGPDASASNVDDLQRCARLFQMLGFDVNAASAWGTGVGVEYITIVGHTGFPVAADWTMARSSVIKYNSFRLQISGIKVRAREFRRRPM